MNRVSTFNYERELAANSHMKSLQVKYIENKSFRIFIGSWNVNGQYPNVSLGEHWLSSDPNPPDIYAIGFQELDLSKEAFLFNDTPREEEWLKAVTVSLHIKTEYVKVKLVRLIGMMLIVFVKKELEEFVTDVSSCTVGTGILGKMGNKGGVSIRFNLHRTSLCFVNSHLAAHPDEFERRNQDFYEICNRTVFQNEDDLFYIKDHDLIYWFGDLNYRLNDLTCEEVKKFIETNNVDSLIKFDQLKQQQKLNKVFVDYNEAPIKHLPTYKYDPGTDNWDSSEKNRPPAWCDRILWTGIGITKCLIYRSHYKLRISDHKPVSALFDTQIRVINQKKYRQTFEEVNKMLDRNENEALPQIAVDKMEINFKEISFCDWKKDTITITNTGLTAIHFEFINKFDQDNYCQPWLKIKPHQGTLLVGDKKSIDIEICVDQRTVNCIPKLNKKLDEILVLHLDKLDKSGGKDIFISLGAEYVSSSFGSSLECLVHLNKSVSEYSSLEFSNLLNKYSSLKKKPNLKSSVTITKPLIDFLDDDLTPKIPENVDKKCWEIPKEIWLIINQLFKYGLDEEELFIQPGLKSEFLSIRKAIDSCYTGKIFGSIHSIAEALLLFLDSLEEPVIPFEFYHKAIESVKNFALCKQILNEIPETHQKVFYYIISFIKEVLKHSNFNKLESNVLATIFGKVMLKQSNQKLNYDLMNTSDSRSKGLFIYHFLINDFDV